MLSTGEVIGHLPSKLVVDLFGEVGPDHCQEGVDDLGLHLGMLTLTLPLVLVYSFGSAVQSSTPGLSHVSALWRSWGLGGFE
jgi:hypothetical protein